MYSYTLSLTSALDGAGLSTLRPGRFSPGTHGWPPGPVWTVAENINYNGIRSPDRPVRWRVAIPTELSWTTIIRNLDVHHIRNR